MTQTRSVVSEDDLVLEADYLGTGQPGDLVLKTGGVERTRLRVDGTGTGLFGDVPAPAATYRLGKDAFFNIAIGSTLASLQPGVTGANNSAPCQRNTTLGYQALNAETTGQGQVAIGDRALSVLTNGKANIAVGQLAMGSATGGDRNVAVGSTALQNLTGGLYPSTTNGTFNTAVGDATGKSMTTGYANTLVGSSAGTGITTGDHHTFIGESAGQFVQGGTGLVVVGADSLNLVTTAPVAVVAVGVGCLASASMTGSDIVVMGQNAGAAVTTAQKFTAVGSLAGDHATTATSSTFLGYAAGFGVVGGQHNTMIGANAGQLAAVAGTKNTCLGSQSGNTGSTDQNNMTLLGYGTTGTADGVVAIGIDNAGTAATAAVANDFVLGTALHLVKIPGSVSGFTIAEAANVVLGTTTGTKIGTATSQKLGFHNSAPVIQRAGAAQVAVATTASTSTTPFGYTTAAQADAIVTLVNEIRAALVEKGLIKGAA